MKEELKKAFDNKNLESYVWKGKKELINNEYHQTEKRLVDMSIDELNQAKSYCEMMLYNTSKTHPGRYNVLNLINQQMNRCGIELCLRWLKQERGITPYQLHVNLRDYFKNKLEDKSELTVKDMFDEQVPSEFYNLPVDLLLDGCLDKLGKFDKAHITLNFILKQGLWFTQKELQELTEYDSEKNKRNRLEVVKERLNLSPEIKIKISEKGLTFSQFRAALTLKSKKYSEIATDQLKVLREQLLFLLEDEVMFHIKQWEERIRQIDKVKSTKN